MNSMNKIGKFEGLSIVNAIDRALIERYGINLTDARVTRYDALSAYADVGDAVAAADLIASQRGLPRLPETKRAA